MHQYNKYGFVRNAQSPDELKPNAPMFPQDYRRRVAPRKARDNRDVNRPCTQASYYSGLYSDQNLEQDLTNPLDSYASHLNTEFNQ